MDAATDERGVGERGRPHQLGARHFEPAQVVAVPGHAHGVRVGERHPDAQDLGQRLGARAGVRMAGAATRRFLFIAGKISNRLQRSTGQAGAAGSLPEARPIAKEDCRRAARRAVPASAAFIAGPSSRRVARVLSERQRQRQREQGQQDQRPAHPGREKDRRDQKGDPEQQDVFGERAARAEPNGEGALASSPLVSMSRRLLTTRIAVIGGPARPTPRPPPATATTSTRSVPRPPRAEEHEDEQVADAQRDQPPRPAAVGERAEDRGEPDGDDRRPAADGG